VDTKEAVFMVDENGNITHIGEGTTFMMDNNTPSGANQGNPPEGNHNTLGSANKDNPTGGIQ
jgi:hypothetical protein